MNEKQGKGRVNRGKGRGKGRKTCNKCGEKISIHAPFVSNCWKTRISKVLQEVLQALCNCLSLKDKFSTNFALLLRQRYLHKHVSLYTSFVDSFLYFKTSVFSKRIYILYWNNVYLLIPTTKYDRLIKALTAPIHITAPVIEGITQKQIIAESTFKKSQWIHKPQDVHHNKTERITTLHGLCHLLTHELLKETVTAVDRGGSR